jgi:hypothetical protein
MTFFGTPDCHHCCSIAAGILILWVSPSSSNRSLSVARRRSASVSAVSPLVAFYEIYGRKGEVLI